MSSLRMNVIFNYLNVISGIIFPLITFPYVSRILLPDGIGIINFQVSIINYIVLITSLGIPLYAVKEVAKYRDDIYKRNKILIEIIILSFLLCFVGYVAVFVLSHCLTQINDNIELFYILSLSILFTSIGANWFYQGIEEFKYITIRAFFIRTIVAISLFIFVKEKDDILIYGLITVGTSVGNNIINFIYLRKYLSISLIKKYKLNIVKHLKPALKIFILNVIVSIYVNLNTVMLGLVNNDYAVGIYTAGNKLPHIVLSLVASMGVVLLPRCSNLVASGRMDDFYSVCNKAIRVVLTLSLPSTIGLILLAKPIVLIFCGEEFLDATLVLYWTAPVVLFIGLTNVIGIQFFYPLGKENIVIYSTIGGAIINLILNLLLMPKYSYIGAGVSTFFAELLVLSIQIILGYKYLSRVNIPYSQYGAYFVALVCMIIVIVPIIIFVCNDLLMLLLSIILGGLIYFISLYFLNDKLVKEFMNYAIKYVK